MAQFKDLLVFGTTRVLDTVYAKQFVGDFVGNLSGNATTATSATNDSHGQNISDTYIKSIEADDDSTSITITYGDNDTTTISTYNTQVEVVDNLTTQDSDAALSANQGYVLNQSIEALASAAAWGTF
jgi:ABC-type sugar transport system ATPase subunit